MISPVWRTKYIPIEAGYSRDIAGLIEDQISQGGGDNQTATRIYQCSAPPVTRHEYVEAQVALRRLIYLLVGWIKRMERLVFDRKNRDSPPSGPYSRISTEIVLLCD